MASLYAVPRKALIRGDFSVIKTHSAQLEVTKSTPVLSDNGKDRVEVEFLVLSKYLKDEALTVTVTDSSESSEMMRRVFSAVGEPDSTQYDVLKGKPFRATLSYPGYGIHYKMNRIRGLE